MTYIPLFNFAFMIWLITNNVPVTFAQDNAARLKEANTDLTSEMVYHLFHKYPPNLVSIVGYPLLYFLGLVALYAKNPPYEQLLNILNLQNDHEIREVFPKILPILKKSNDGINFDLSMTVFADLSNPFSACFMRDVRNILNGQLRNVNYRTPVRTAADINALIKRTVPRNGNVNSTTPITPHLISKLRKNSLLFTAAYNFSWNWEYPFNPKYTKLGDYDTGLGYKIKLPLMYRIGYYKYANLTDLEAQAIELPFKGRNYGVLLVVPYQANGIEKLSTKLRDPEVFKSINARMRYQHLQIYYPKGKLAESINLLRNIEEITSCKLLLNDIKGAFASGCNANVAGIYASVYTSDDEGYGDIDYEMNCNSEVPKVKMNKPLIYYIMHIKDGKNDPLLAGMSTNLMNVPVE